MVQRVLRARITVAGEEVARMDAGLLALVGVAQGDAEADADELARKLVGLRIFADEDGRMNRALPETGGTLGVVSQFTLLGDTRRGRRPSFTGAAPPDVARPLVERVARAAAAAGVPVVSGRFGAHMEVDLANDGPVTLLVDTSA